MKMGPVRLLVLLNLLLAGVLAYLWVNERAQIRNVDWVAPKALLPAIAAPVNTMQATPSSSTLQYFAILERPIFAPDRRPPPPPTPPPPPDPMANIQLLGTFSGNNAGVLARIDGRVSRVKINETIGPWTLKSVVGRDVTFAQGEETRQLRLNYSQLGVLAPQAAAQATAPPKLAGGGATSALTITQSNQDEMRDRLRRRNEIRAAKGLPPVTD